MPGINNPDGQKLRRFREALRESRRTGVPVDEVFGRREEEHRLSIGRSLERSIVLEDTRREGIDAVLSGQLSEFSRREFLHRGALTGFVIAGALGGLGWSTATDRRANAATAPRIVVVGAGIAGTTAAYRINKLTGWVPQIFEASTRTGGRARTIRQMSGSHSTTECAGCHDGSLAFPFGSSTSLWTEAGCGGINTRDTAVKNLCQEIGLWPLVDTWLNYPGGEETYRFGGKSYTWSQLQPGVKAIENHAWSIWRKIGYVPTARRFNATAKAWDRRSMKRLIDDSRYPTTTPAGAYVAMTYGVEYGGPIERSSALSMILEQGNFWGPAAGYDERWQVLGGMSMLPETLAALLPEPVQLDQALAAIVRNGNGTYTLTFKSGAGATTTVVADRVVLAIPPSALRRVDYTKAGLSAHAAKAIRSERMGTVNKLAFQFAGRPWADNGRSGDAYSDGPTGMAWQESFLSTNPATLVVLNQVDYGAAPPHGVAPAAVTTDMMAAVDAMWPGSSAKLIAGQSYLDNWTQDPYAKGCYPYYGLNGFTTYGGYQRKRQGEIYFVGDWASKYVERSTICGAVSSAERAAKTIANH